MTVPESKIRKVFIEDIKWIITIVTIVASVMLSYGSISTKIALVEQRLDTIENNHLVHMQEAIEKLSDRLSDHLEEK